jgi:hypothetical protein
VTTGRLPGEGNQRKWKTKEKVRREGKRRRREPAEGEEKIRR